jgi:hypothetical protein
MSKLSDLKAIFSGTGTLTDIPTHLRPLVSAFLEGPDVTGPAKMLVKLSQEEKAARSSADPALTAQHELVRAFSFDDFIELGAHSELATQMSERARTIEQLRNELSAMEEQHADALEALHPAATEIVARRDGGRPLEAISIETKATITDLYGKLNNLFGLMSFKLPNVRLKSENYEELARLLSQIDENATATRRSTTRRPGISLGEMSWSTPNGVGKGSAEELAAFLGCNPNTVSVAVKAAINESGFEYDSTVNVTVTIGGQDIKIETTPTKPMLGRKAKSEVTENEAESDEPDEFDFDVEL